MAECIATKSKTNGFNAIWSDYKRMNIRAVIKMWYFLTRWWRRLTKFFGLAQDPNIKAAKRCLKAEEVK